MLIFKKTLYPFSLVININDDIFISVFQEIVFTSFFCQIAHTAKRLFWLIYGNDRYPCELLALDFFSFSHSFVHIYFVEWLYEFTWANYDKDEKRQQWRYYCGYMYPPYHRLTTKLYSPHLLTTTTMMMMMMSLD